MSSADMLLHRTPCSSLLVAEIINSNLCNEATGYVGQQIWCLSQAKINWEGCGRKGIQRKNGGMMEVGR